MHVTTIILTLKYSCFLPRPEKTKLQIIPGQLNITVECVPVDLPSKNVLQINIDSCNWSLSICQ